MTGTFNARIYFLIRGLVQSTRGKYFLHADCYFPLGKNIFSMGIITFLKGKTFSSRGLLLSSKGKHFLQGDCYFPQGKNIFFKEIVTFLKGKIFSSRGLLLSSWGLLHSQRGLSHSPWGMAQFSRGASNALIELKINSIEKWKSAKKSSQIEKKVFFVCKIDGR